MLSFILDSCLSHTPMSRSQYIQSAPTSKPLQNPAHGHYQVHTTAISCLFLGLSASVLIPPTSQESSVILPKCTSEQESSNPRPSISLSPT